MKTDSAPESYKLNKQLIHAAEIVRAVGAKKFAKVILPWHFRRRYIIYTMDLPVRTASVSPPAPRGFRLDLAEESDLAAIMAVHPHYYSETQLSQRFKAGHLCFIGWVEDEPTHLRWHFVHELYLPYLKRTMRLAPQEVWADEGYTKPSYRKTGIFAYAGYLITLRLAEMGFQRLSCAFASWNATPQHLDRERGMSPVGEVRFRKYFGRSSYAFSGRVRECGDDRIEIAAENIHS